MVTMVNSKTEKWRSLKRISNGVVGDFNKTIRTKSNIMVKF